MSDEIIDPRTFDHYEHDARRLVESGEAMARLRRDIGERRTHPVSWMRRYQDAELRLRGGAQWFRDRWPDDPTVRRYIEDRTEGEEATRSSAFRRFRQLIGPADAATLMCAATPKRRREIAGIEIAVETSTTRAGERTYLDDGDRSVDDPSRPLGRVRMRSIFDDILGDDEATRRLDQLADIVCAAAAGETEAATARRALDRWVGE